MNNKKSGFTLSEILIALGVIGVVASLSLPQLINNHQKKTYVTSVRKTIIDIENGFAGYLADNNVNNLNFTNFTSNPDLFFTNYLKLAKKGSTYASTFASGYRTISGADSDFSSDSCGKYYTLSGGASVCVPSTCTPGICKIYIDTNATKEPNIVGRDLFAGIIFSDGSIDIVSPSDRNTLLASEIEFKRITGETYTDSDEIERQAYGEELFLACHEAAHAHFSEEEYQLFEKGQESLLETTLSWSKSKDKREEWIKEYIEKYSQNNSTEASGSMENLLNSKFEDFFNDLYSERAAELEDAVNKQDEIRNAKNEIANKQSKRYDYCKGGGVAASGKSDEKNPPELACLGALIQDNWEMNY